LMGGVNQTQQRLLQVDEDDVIERLATMEGRIDGIVRKDRVRPMELETAVKLAKNLSDLKLNTAVKEVQDALSRKVDKPTEEQVTRRTVRMWKTGIADKQHDQAAIELGKFQSALTAKKEQRALEDFDARAAEEHAASLIKEQRKTVGEQAPTSGTVAALMGGVNQTQLGQKISDTAKDLADAVATPEGDGELPSSPHRALLEKQFRRELQDSAGRMVSGIASSIKRRMGDEGPSRAGGYLSPAAARDMAVRDVLAANREVGNAYHDMRAAGEVAHSYAHPAMIEAAGAPAGVVPGLPPRLSAAEMDLALRDARHGDIDRAAFDAAVRGDHIDRRLTEELRIEDAIRHDAAMHRMAPPAGLARARSEVERLSGELSREAVTGVETYLRGPDGSTR
jgi:hypothetical protein